jgi:hypothetical protein
MWIHIVYMRNVLIVHVCVARAEVLKVSRTSGTVSTAKKEERTSSVEEEETVTDKPYTHLTQFEIDGLRKIVAWLRSLPDNKRCIPADIPDSDALLADVEVSGWLYCCYICVSSEGAVFFIQMNNVNQYRKRAGLFEEYVY